MLGVFHANAEASIMHDRQRNADLQGVRFFRMENPLPIDPAVAPVVPTVYFMMF
jgi:hypothetical protein